MDGRAEVKLVAGLDSAVKLADDRARKKITPSQMAATVQPMPASPLPVGTVDGMDGDRLRSGR